MRDCISRLIFSACIAPFYRFRFSLFIDSLCLPRYYIFSSFHHHFFKWLLIFALLFSFSCKDNNPIDGSIITPPIETFRTIDTEPAWSPDGKTIAHVHVPRDSAERQQGPTGIWLSDLQTMSKTFLTAGSEPDWSPDGKKIAFEQNADIYIIDVETKQEVQLTTWGSCFFPSWSPDGKKIAFDTDFDDLKGANVIWIMNTDGSGKKDISQHNVGEWREPKWSRNGLKILHIRYIGVTFPELFLMDTAGNNAIRLTYNSFTDRDHAWSPDGSKIAWGSYGEGSDPASGIWVMNTDGTDQKQLTHWGGYPSWSPDGTKIVYYQTNPDSNTGTLWIMNADGTNQQQLTKP
jgi:Tol biopolymer transport system component